jgi:hypothetical protein
MAKKKTQNTNSIKIQKIKDISFEIKENLFRENDEIIRFHIGHKIGFNSEINFVNLKLMVLYSYPDAPNEIVFKIEVENVFEISNLNMYLPKAKDITSENMKVPSEILIAIVGISISHTRALLAKNLSGTAFGDIYLPVLSSLELAKFFFGKDIILANMSK